MTSLVQTDVRVERLRFVDKDLGDQVTQLLRQEYSDCRPLTDHDLWGYLETDADKLYCARSGDQLVGVMLLTMERPLTGGTVCRVSTLVVDPKFRRQGIASRLLQCARTDMPAGTNFVDLLCPEGSESAFQFALNLGFFGQDSRTVRRYRLAA